MSDNLTSNQQAAFMFIRELQRQFGEHCTLSDIEIAEGNNWGRDTAKVCKAYGVAHGQPAAPASKKQRALLDVLRAARELYDAFAEFGPEAQNFCDYVTALSETIEIYDETDEPPAEPPAAPSSDELHRKLAESGVFKGFEGLEGLLNAQEFWDEQAYGTRLYYGGGIADYLHRDVLRAAIRILKQPARPVEQPADALAAGDVIAHQLLYRDHGEILERWWQARGGHAKCSVCSPARTESETGTK